MTGSRRVVLLAGGVGGAKLADGLAAEIGGRLTVIVNTADDTERHGLLVSPDHDTIVYTLAGLVDETQGWGLAGETWSAATMLERLGEEVWFRLGDGDLAVHIVRTRRLRDGERLTLVAREIQRRLGCPIPVLPMSDQPVRTEVLTDDGWLDFQEYFVHRHQSPLVHELRLRGVESATSTPEVLGAIAAADVVVIGPSNPLLSIGPILAVAGVREAIGRRRGGGGRIVAVSGLIAGRALRGPADRLLASLGHESTALGVARLYAGVADTFVLDRVDAGLAPAVEELGFRPVVLDTVMLDRPGRRRLAGELLAAVG